MKFIHIADVHLGAEPSCGKYTECRKQEIWDTFKGIIEICNREESDALFIAGDLFHRQPLLRELKEVNYIFSTLKKTKVFLIAGNHDYIKKESYYKTFNWNENVYPIFTEQLSYVEVKELSLAVYGLSYFSKEITEELYNVVAPGIAKYEVLLAHGGDAKHIPVNYAKLNQSGFDYIAMGHIHKPGAPLKNKAVYSGALEPVDINDVGPHGYVKGTLESDNVHIEFIPFAKRKYVHLQIDVDSEMTQQGVTDIIRESIEKRGVQNMYKIQLTGKRDPEIEFDTYYMNPFGNIVEIEDMTTVAIDYEKIYYKNKDNVIGKYIESFKGCKAMSKEYMAMEEGVSALLKG